MAHGKLNEAPAQISGDLPARNALALLGCAADMVHEVEPESGIGEQQVADSVFRDDYQAERFVGTDGKGKLRAQTEQPVGLKNRRARHLFANVPAAVVALVANGITAFGDKNETVAKRILLNESCSRWLFAKIEAYVFTDFHQVVDAHALKEWKRLEFNEKGILHDV